MQYPEVRTNRKRVFLIVVHHLLEEIWQRSGNGKMSFELMFVQHFITSKKKCSFLHHKPVFRLTDSREALILHCFSSTR